MDELVNDSSHHDHGSLHRDSGDRPLSGIPMNRKMTIPANPSNIVNQNFYLTPHAVVCLASLHSFMELEKCISIYACMYAYIKYKIMYVYIYIYILS